MIERLGIGLAVISLVVGLVFFMESQQAARFEHLEDSLEEIETRLEDMVQVIDRHEEFVSGEHLDLLRALATSQDDINFRIGVLTGRLVERGEER